MVYRGRIADCEERRFDGSGPAIGLYGGPGRIYVPVSYTHLGKKTDKLYIIHMNMHK